MKLKASRPIQVERKADQDRILKFDQSLMKFDYNSIKLYQIYQNSAKIRRIRNLVTCHNL
jgi:hypothetical protein